MGICDNELIQLRIVALGGVGSAGILRGIYEYRVEDDTWEERETEVGGRTVSNNIILIN